MCKLTKEDLLAGAQFCEVAINPETRKPEIVETLISAPRLQDPVQERGKERGRRSKERRAREGGGGMFQLELAKVAAREQEQKLELVKLTLEQEKLKANNSALQRRHKVLVFSFSHTLLVKTIIG